METYTIDILNHKAIKLLQDLEALQLIRLRKEKVEPQRIDWASKHKGAMTKQPLTEIENQVNELRNGWE